MAKLDFILATYKDWLPEVSQYTSIDKIKFYRDC